MKKIWIMVLFFSSSAFAQGGPQPLNALSFSSLAQVQKSANVMRAHEKEIHDFFMQIVLRKAQMDISSTLTKNHLSESEIANVMESDVMKKFLVRLQSNPQIEAQVQSHVQKLLQPGEIETYVMKQREQLAKQIQDQIVASRNDLRKSQNFRSKEEVFTDPAPRSLASIVWQHLVDDLYKD